MEKLIRVLEGITATLWAITILYSIFFFSLGGFLLNDIFQEILISLITGAISSLVFTSISYFAFLHKIPEKTYEKIEKLLNDRLGYETTNHNAVMGALNPNNEVLLNLVSKDHRELKVLTGETLQHLRMEKAAKENREQMIINGLLSERIQTLLKYATTSLEPEQESKLIEEITSAINHIKMENEQIAHHRQELEKAMRDIEQHDLEVAQKQELKEIQGHHFGGLSI